MNRQLRDAIRLECEEHAHCATPIGDNASFGSDGDAGKVKGNAALALVCHGSAPPPSRLDLVVTVVASGPRRLALRYALTGDLDRLRIPGPAAGTRKDHLWEHTCFEAFLGSPSGEGYLEFNFSPSGEWAAYAFRRYRERAPDPVLAIPPAIRRKRGKHRLEVDVDLEDFDPGDPSVMPVCRTGFCAVIEAQSGTLSYWALVHPGARPDFHDPAGFTHTMDFSREPSTE